ncbi:MAG: DUF1289 domain-containing protein [Nitrosomonadales bacterium]|nr:DUF1289 domain-containing protein [Nitrosomonadales bacterium]
MTLPASGQVPCPTSQLSLDSISPQEITSASPCIGHCTTVLGDDVCRSCLRTFEEVACWLGMNEEERRGVNRRIALLAGKPLISKENN